MAKQKMSGGYDLGRLVDQSGGMVDDVVYPALLKDNEAHLLKNVSLDEKGTVKTCKGRRERFASDFSVFPVNGIAPYYKSDGTTRLLMGAGNSLYVDTPHVTEVYDSQPEWETGTREKIDTTTTVGSIQPTAPYTNTETTTAELGAGTLSNISASDNSLRLGAGSVGWSSGTNSLFAWGTGTQGVEFKVSSNVIVTSLGLMSAVGTNIECHLWRVSDQAKLAQVVVSATAGVWSYAELATPITLSAGSRYIASYSPATSSHYSLGSLTIDPSITIISFRTNTSSNTYPNTGAGASFAAGIKLGYASTGNRISPAKDISSITSAGGGKISWAETTNGQTISVETRLSTDGGSNWGAWSSVTNGGSIPGITSGLDLTNYRLQTRVTLSTSDASVTPQLHDISIRVYSLSRWTSPTIDVSTASDKTSGHVTLAQTTEGSSAVAIESRSSADGTTWGAWTAASVDGSLNHTANNFIQVRLILTPDASNLPSVQKATVAFDGTPTATLLSSGFTQGGEFFFASLMDYIVAVNGIDAPQKYDGTTLGALGGSPPRGHYIATHKNYLWMAHTSSATSRLYFSSVLDIESWPVLNFIDISPNDGDYITGLLSFDDYLIITKQRSVWVLLGSGSSDFEVRRIHEGVGCIAPRSLVKMPNYFAFASSEGIYISNLSEPVLITERLKETWADLNRRNLDVIAGEFYDHKLRVDVPNASSSRTNLRIVFDTIRKALYLEEFTEHASCYCKYVEAGQEVLLYGHSNTGQLSQADTGTTDAGSNITMTWETKWFDFGSGATEKKVKRTYFVIVPASSDVTVTVQYIVDGAAKATTQDITVTGNVNSASVTKAIRAQDSDVNKVRTLGYKITQTSSNGGVKFLELLQQYVVRKVRATA